MLDALAWSMRPLNAALHGSGDPLITQLAEPSAALRSLEVVLSVVWHLNALESCNWHLAPKLVVSAQDPKPPGQLGAKLRFNCDAQTKESDRSLRYAPHTLHATSM